MQVYVPKRTLKILIILCTMMLLTVIAVAAGEFISCRGCRAVSGTITKTRTDIDTYSAGSSTGRSSRNHYYTCEYTVDGRTCRAEFFTIIPKKTGKRVLVFYDPADPSHTVNNSTVEICISAGIFLILFVLFCVKGIEQEKHTE